MTGCFSYVVAEDADENAIWVTEVWDSIASHDGSLSLPSVKKAIPHARRIVPLREHGTRSKVGVLLGKTVHVQDRWSWHPETGNFAFAETFLVFGNHSECNRLLKETQQSPILRMIDSTGHGRPMTFALNTPVRYDNAAARLPAHGALPQPGSTLKEEQNDDECNPSAA